MFNSRLNAKPMVKWMLDDVKCCQFQDFMDVQIGGKPFVDYVIATLQKMGYLQYLSPNLNHALYMAD